MFGGFEKWTRIDFQKVHRISCDAASHCAVLLSSPHVRCGPLYN